jgi:hypothetical protein
MKTVFILMLAMTAFSAQAVDVTFKCSPKAFQCQPNGVCQWFEMYEGVTTTIVLDQDNFDREIYRARYQSLLDGHQLTLDFRYDHTHPTQPLRVNAYLGATNVMAETSGSNKIDVALRNNNYGRGFNCTQIRARY